MHSTTVRAPASSANLGPGYDVLAAALQLDLTLTVTRSNGFSIDPGHPLIRSGRENLCVQAFEILHPADNMHFDVSLDMPSRSGLGTSAAAIVAGLLAGAQYSGHHLSREALLAHGLTLEEHPDNLAAAIYGGFVACAVTEPAAPPRPPVLMTPPRDIVPVIAIPDQRVKTSRARTVVPEDVPLTDAVANIGAACSLMLGIERSDPHLIACGLADRLHQRARSHLYHDSMALLSSAQAYGALGATISGAGPAVLFWCHSNNAMEVLQAIQADSDSTTDVFRVAFSADGATVLDLAHTTVEDERRIQ